MKMDSALGLAVSNVARSSTLSALGSVIIVVFRVVTFTQKRRQTEKASVLHLPLTRAHISMLEALSRQSALEGK